MKVKRSEILALLLDMNMLAADGWTLPQMVSKVNQEGGGISRYKEEDHEFSSPEFKKLYEDIVVDQTNGNLVEIEDDSETAAADAKANVPETDKPAEAPAKPAPKPAAKPKAEKDAKPKAKPKAEKAAPKAKSKAKAKPSANGDKKSPWPKGSWQAQAAYWKKNPKEVTDRGPGVMRTVIKELKHAGKNPDKPKPITKDDLLGVLTKEFKDRTPEKMMTYLNNLVPTGLRNEYGIHVWKAKGDKGEKTGYYIVGDGDKPQPKAPKAAKASA